MENYILFNKDKQNEVSVDAKTMWGKKNPIVLYVHIPFCNNVCSCCIYNKYSTKGVLLGEYLGALERGELPDKISGIKELVQLPFTHKQDFRDYYPFGFLASENLFFPGSLQLLKGIQML